jgi:predicted O-methyltransferase YrrM
MPVAFVTALLRRAIGFQPVIPWIPYPAIRHLKTLIKPEWNVIEFGSGMSTVWLAQRAKHVVSIEHIEYWHTKVSHTLNTRGLADRVSYEFRDSDRYSDLSDYPDASFDFAVIDGAQRRDCVLSVLPKMVPGGWIYLDNTDLSEKEDALTGAEDALLSAARDVEYFIGFPPTLFFVGQGLLVKV